MEGHFLRSSRGRLRSAGDPPLHPSPRDITPPSPLPRGAATQRAANSGPSPHPQPRPQPLRDTRTPSPGPRDASCRPRRFPQLRPRGRANSALRDRAAARLGQFRAFRSTALPRLPLGRHRSAPKPSPPASPRPTGPTQASPHPRSPSRRLPHLVSSSPPQPTVLRGSSCGSRRLRRNEPRSAGRKAAGASRGGGQEGEDFCAFKVDLKTACKLLGCSRNAGVPQGSPQLPCPAPQSAKCPHFASERSGSARRGRPQRRAPAPTQTKWDWGDAAGATLTKPSVSSSDLYTCPRP